MKKIILFCILSILVIDLCGCEAFSRKFTRKRKSEDKKSEEMVLEPEEYPAAATDKAELYRQYFLFWSSWQDELSESLASPNPNRKKHLDCIREAVKNLTAMKELLQPEKQKLLGDYIERLNRLAAEIEKDLYSTAGSEHLAQAQKIGRAIHHDFVFSRMKDYLL